MDRYAHYNNNKHTPHVEIVKTGVKVSVFSLQFERGILDACIYILDASRMPIYNRGNVIKLVRRGSAMVRALTEQKQILQ